MILVGSPIAVIRVPFYTGEDVSRRALGDGMVPASPYPIGIGTVIPDLVATGADPELAHGMGTATIAATMVVSESFNLALYLGRPHVSILARLGTLY